MDIGNKIVNLRKNNNLSQEDLAEKIGVTRQTISKWELGETKPDIKQALELSKIFNISLDELANNDLNSVIIEKVSNTEKLAGLIIKILKIIGICILLFLILGFISIFLLTGVRRTSSRTIIEKYDLVCTLDNKVYEYGFEFNEDHQIINAGGDAFIANHTNIEKYDDADVAVAQIEDYFKEHNGSCTIN